MSATVSSPYNGTLSSTPQNMFSSARNIRSHSNRKGQAGGHRSSSSNATGVKSEVVKSVRVGKDTVPSGSDANTVHCSTGSPRVTPGTEGPKNPRMTRKRRKVKASGNNGFSSDSLSSVQSSKQKQNDSKRHRGSAAASRLPRSAMVDSGRGDELSSSCDSDHLGQVVKAPPGGPQSPVASNSHSDLDEEFQDALSNLPSENEQSKSSTSSSVFVTPLSTRSQSPVHSSKAACEVNMQLQDKLAKVVDSLSGLAEKQDNTDSSGIASDVSKDTVVDASSTQDSSSYEKNGHGSSDEKEEGSLASGGIKANPKPAGTGGSSKTGSRRRINGMQRSKTRRSAHSKSEPAAKSDSPPHSGDLREAESDLLMRDASGCGSEPQSEDPTSSLDFHAPVSRKPHVRTGKNKRSTGVEHQDRGVHHQILKPQPLLPQATLQDPKEQRPLSQSLPSSKGQKGCQLRVEFSSLSSASPASSLCSYSPVTLSPSPTASLQLHPTAAEAQLAGLPASHHLELDSATTNLTPASGELQEPPTFNGKGGHKDEGKDEWPDFGSLMCGGGGSGSCNRSVSNGRPGASDNLESLSESSGIGCLLQKPVDLAGGTDCRRELSSSKEGGADDVPCDDATHSAAVPCDTPSPHPEAPSSAFKVISTVSKSHPSISEFPSSAFKVFPTSAVPISSSEVPSSAFKVHSGVPEDFLTSEPKSAISVTTIPLCSEDLSSAPIKSQWPDPEELSPSDSRENPAVAEKEKAGDKDQADEKDQADDKDQAGKDQADDKDQAGDKDQASDKDKADDKDQACDKDQASDKDQDGDKDQDVEEDQDVDEDQDGEEDQDSGCNMSTCSGGGDSTTSGGGKGGSLKSQPPEQMPVDHFQYPMVSEAPLTTLCNPVLSPDQYLQLKRDQLNMFVQQYQENLEKQTDNQIFFPVDPSPPSPHLSTIMMSSPPVPMLSPPSVPMLAPAMFVQSPPPPLHHLHPMIHDVRTSLAAGVTPYVSTSPPPAPPPPLPPNIPYDVVLPQATQLAAVDNQDKSATTVHSISPTAAEFHPREEVVQESCLEEVEHLLSDSWVMWFDCTSGMHRNHSSNYKASLNEVSSISSIEQFWQVYNHIKNPQEMEQGSNLHFFKQGIQPMWEDPANQDGGKWVLTIKGNLERLAKCWMEMLLLLVGAGVEKGHLINGVVTSRRKKGDRIALWTSTRDEEANLDICIDLVRAVMLAYEVPLEDMESFMKELSEGRCGMSLVFMYHSDALASGHSYQNNAHIKMADHIEVIVRELRRVHITNAEVAD